MLIDVRRPDEFAAQHAEGALNIPVEDIEAGKLGVLATTPKNESLELYCRAGGRAGRAQAMLMSQGFTSVRNLGGLSQVLRAQNGTISVGQNKLMIAIIALVLSVILYFVLF